MGEAKRRAGRKPPIGGAPPMEIKLDWTFEATLQELIRQLKPNVAAWGNEMYPVLRQRLREATDGSQATMATQLTSSNGVWIFTAMTHNRGIGTDVQAMLASTKQTDELMQRLFLQAAEMKICAPTDALKQ
jgi:hypothetical protein